MVFGNRLKVLRNKKGMSQQKLATESGVHWRTISRLENNWQPDPATRGKASFVIDNGNVLLDEVADWKAWAVAYRKITGYTVAEARGDSMRKDLLADIDRFVRSLE